jgi:hypothetical protein
MALLRHCLAELRAKYGDSGTEALLPAYAQTYRTGIRPGAVPWPNRDAVTLRRASLSDHVFADAADKEIKC